MYPPLGVGNSHAPTADSPDQRGSHSMRLYRQECVVVVSARVIKRAESAESVSHRRMGMGGSGKVGFGVIVK